MIYLKEATTTIVSLAVELNADFEDGKLSLKEAVGLLDNFIQMRIFFTRFNELRSEVKNMTPAQREYLKNHVAAELEIPNDRAEKIVEAAVNLIFDIGAGIMGIVEATK